MTDQAGGGFTAAWLALREPVDHRSRVVALTGLLDEWLRRRLAGGRSILRAVDLGAGAGSNWRYLSVRLNASLRWRLLDQDAALLARVRADGVRVVAEVTDFGPSPAPWIADADLVTASALVDLAGGPWIDDLAAACGAARATVLVALTIDGRVVFDPPDPLDATVCDWLARDEQRDKGLGAARGPDAPAALVAALQARGYAVTTAASDWRLGPADAALMRALLGGWHLAARRQAPAQRAAIDAWFSRRCAAIAAGQLRVRVGHQDVLGLPPA